MTSMSRFSLLIRAGFLGTTFALGRLLLKFRALGGSASVCYDARGVLRWWMVALDGDLTLRAAGLLLVLFVR